ncbi:MAG: Adaptive-response sensory-kinase SasA [Chroococcidiopsis cubana SAG 39.79]|nr:HAMP domain-containing sensor histidine kinase [Chroococcidiopsis cubana]MDZ4873335.1 Adaptive-response sensory-kinase SasA [Chroococcidiopsis cubana SAG 39.79]
MHQKQQTWEVSDRGQKFCNRFEPSKTEVSPPNRFDKTQQWRRIFYSLRTSILIWYVLLLTCSAFLSTLVIRQVLLARLEARHATSLLQEVKEFRVLANGKDPNTGKPFQHNLKALFKVFLNRNIPDDDEFLIAIIEGEIDRSSPRALPEPLKQNSELIQYFGKLTQPEQGARETAVGTILYRAAPIIRDETHGVFVVAQLTAGERQEVNEAMAVIIQVKIFVIIGAAILAWLVAGRTLTPLHLLTETARSIRESDLTRRIPVKGSDEVAELATTFNEMLDRLQAAFSSQRNFINDASHELRTPITIIRGHLELMGDDPQEREETVALVTDELDRMSRFIDDLLLLAKAEQPNFLKLERLDLTTLVAEIYSKAIALSTDRHWQIDRHSPGAIIADRQRLTQAMINLAQNATQHTTTGDTIALGCMQRHNWVRLWVRDTGEGISLADQQRIFERFARTTKSQRRSEGAGLGLAIVRAIAQAHGGKIELSSRPHRGSTFTIVLPIEPTSEISSHE